jgi:radical SAM superfamily enzyme YgiQ (UPF0313 family)
LLTVAGTFSPDYDCRLVDMNATRLRPADIKWADIVLTGGMMLQRPSTEWVIEQCNQMKVPVVVGGPDATSSHDNIKGNPHFVLGEAEGDQVIGAFERMFSSREQIILDLRDQTPNVNDSPMPRYNLLWMNQYLHMAIQLSRGCPFQCEFCDIPELFGRVPRYKTEERVIRELDELYRWGWWGDVFWVDDNFIGNKKSAKEILPSIAAWQKAHGKPFHFYTQTSVNLAGDEELLSSMVKAGFYSVFLGIETPVEASLLETKKVQNVKYDLLESIRKIQGSGMEVMAGFIIGFDNDPDDIDRQLINFIQDSGIPSALVGLLSAIPSSPLHARLEKENRLFPAHAVRKGDATLQFAFNFKTAKDPEILIKAFTNVLREIYGEPDNYFKRVENLFAHHGKKRSPVPKLPFSSFLQLFARVVLKMPTSAYGRSFARFLRQVFSKYPKRLPDAIRHGVVGWHFYELTHERLAAADFEGFVTSAIEAAGEANGWERGEGLKNIEVVLADARKKLRKLPPASKADMTVLYEEFEGTLKELAASESA